MKAALVTTPGGTPVYTDFAEPSIGNGTVRVTVAASALSHVTKSRASGKHYSASGTLPLVPGIDGTGVLDDGTRVYFLLPSAPYGAMAEVTVVDASHCIALPDGLDDVTAAAIAIPGMSSWAALVERAKLVAGETVLVNGATGTSGRLAVQIAKHLGARKVIATGRNAAALAELQAIGADVTISLTQPEAALREAFEAQCRAGIDVVLDYLWGPSALQWLTAGATVAPAGVPIRFIQIGAVSGGTIALPSAVLRSSCIEIKGSGIGSVPMPRLFHAVKQVLAATAPAGFRIATKAVPLSAVGDYWDDSDSQARVVLTLARPPLRSDS